MIKKNKLKVGRIYKKRVVNHLINSYLLLMVVILNLSFICVESLNLTFLILISLKISPFLAALLARIAHLDLFLCFNQLNSFFFNFM